VARWKTEANSQEIETFVKEQKGETKKTVSDMKKFQRYLSSISKSDVEVLALLVHLICAVGNDE